jgi:hypothetical protein
LYLLGHMALGYVFASAVARWRHQRLVIWLALVAGILPDVDIFFAGLGLVHHTYTHSLLLLLPIAGVLVWWRRDSLPYVAGVLQHMLVGDFLANSVPLLLPLAAVRVGLELGMPSAADSLIESGSLALMLVVMWRSGDLRRLFDGGRSNLLMLIPLLTMSSLTWLAAGEPELGGLISYGFSRLALEAVSAGQIALAALMAVSVVRSAIFLYRSRSRLR